MQAWTITMSGSERKKTKRRPPGEGSYKTNAKGQVRLVKMVNRKWLAGPYESTRMEALASFNRKYQSGAKDAASQSFTTLAKRWLKERESSQAPSTFKSYTIWIACIEADPLGSMPVKSIKEAHLRQWFARQKLAPTTVRKRLGFIHQMLRIGGNNERYNPPKAEKHTRRPLSAEEGGKAKAIALESDLHTHRVGVMICLEMGLRVSEACGLKHEDYQNGGVWIRRSVTRTKGTLNVREKTKTARSARWVPIPPSLKEHIGPPKKGYVLTESEQPGYPDTLQKAVRSVCKKAGIEGVPHLGPHALRRTYGMTLLEAGVDVVTSAEMMGHDPKMLLDEYARSRIDLKQKAVKTAFGKAKKKAVRTEIRTN